MNVVWKPEWTSEVKIESGGRYPLGLNRFHDGLEDYLIKGIVLAANRLRYYTCCCWIIGDIEVNETCNTYEEFVEAFRKRENALALGLYLIQPEYGVPGSDAISKIINGEKDEYDCTFHLMQSNELGAYGLYYAGSMYDWGLTQTDEKGIKKLTNLGKDIYAIHDEYYRKINPEYYVEYKGKTRVPTSVLSQWGDVNDFDNIVEHGKEREFYQRILFRLDHRTATDLRRDTLLIFLHSINHCAQHHVGFTEGTLQDIHYYQSFYDNEHEVVYSIDMPNALDDALTYWRLYEGHVYFRGWISRYFDVFLKYLKSNDDGKTIDDFLDTINTNQFNETIGYFSGISHNYLDGEMGKIVSLIPEHSILNSPLSESNITLDEEKENFSEVLAKSIIVMSGLYKKFKDVRSKIYYQELQEKLAGDLWFDVFFQLPSFEKMIVSDFLKVMLKKYIVNQHDLIMFEKRDLRRCWFTIENQLYFHQADLSLIWRPAKFQTIMHFLEDLNFIEYDEEYVSLTDEGKTFLKQESSQRESNE